MRNAVLSAINQAISGKDEFLKVLRNNVSAVIGSDTDKTVSSIASRLEELQKELIRLANLHSDYDKIANEIHRLREQKQASLLRNSDLECQKQRIAEMAEFPDAQSGEVLEFDETLVRRLVERITVIEDRVAVEFKSGMEVPIPSSDVSRG